MDFKYNSIIKERKLVGCPPDSCTPKSITGYRWVYEPIEDDKNFLPNHLFSSKVLRKKSVSNNQRDNCMKCGLSLFSQLKIARSHYNSLNSILKKKFQYTHVAEGQINPEDGVVSEITTSGHFTFFESIESDPKSVFEIVEEL